MSSEPVEPADIDRATLLAMTSDIVAAYVGHNKLDVQQIPSIVKSVFSTLAEIGGPQLAVAHALMPAVPIRRSVTDDYIVCLEDGRKLKMLRRHLRTKYGLTPEEYRAKWGLPPDYPMVAPAYAARRSAFAKSIGLGRKGRLSATRGRRKSVKA